MRSTLRPLRPLLKLPLRGHRLSTHRLNHKLGAGVSPGKTSGLNFSSLGHQALLNISWIELEECRA